MTTIDGHLVHGMGLAKNLTQIDWVRRQLIDLVGIDPYPGTLNLDLPDEANRARWRSWCSTPGDIIEPEDADFCRARCYPVRIDGCVPAAVLRPESAGYPADKVELVAALPIRKHLCLGDNARVRVDLCQPLAAKAVLFDIDGTLVDSVGAYLEVARIAAEPFGFEVTQEQVRRCLATGDNFWNGVIPQHLRDGDAIAKAMSAHGAREWPRVLREFGTLFEGVAQTLDALQSRGIRLGIVSGARPEVMELLRAGGILDRFDTVILGGDVSWGKPDPEGICKGLSRLGVLPELALYVGDAPIDIQASHSAGVRAVGVLTGAANSALLSAHGPERLISSHARLPAIVAAHVTS
jgi:HAD superfamily hydrolase (TIGR01549 family)